jgi:hypothetical protein
MIERGHALPLARQAQQLGISRSSIYYLPRPVTDAGIRRYLGFYNAVRSHSARGGRMPGQVYFDLPLLAAA